MVFCFLLLLFFTPYIHSDAVRHPRTSRKFMKCFVSRYSRNFQTILHLWCQDSPGYKDPESLKVLRWAHMKTGGDAGGNTAHLTHFQDCARNRVHIPFLPNYVMDLKALCSKLRSKPGPLYQSLLWIKYGADQNTLWGGREFNNKGFPKFLKFHLLWRYKSWNVSLQTALTSVTRGRLQKLCSGVSIRSPQVTAKFVFPIKPAIRGQLIKRVDI